MPTVEVIEVLEKTYENKPAGKNYTVHEWAASAKIDGGAKQNVTIKTLSNKIAGTVKNGAVFNCKKDEYNGRVKWFIESNVQSASPSTPNASGHPAPSSYTMSDLVRLYASCITEADKMLSPFKPTPADLVAATATLFIQATRIGVKAEQSESKDTAEPKSKTMMEILKVLEDSGMLEKVNGIEGMTDDLLKEWYGDVGGNAIAFISRINSEIRRIEK